MTDNSKEISVIEQAKEDLFNYAIDRQDTNWLMDRLHEEADVNRTTVEYELQVLKIVSTGLAISYHMEQSAHKNLLLEGFWNRILELSKGLSETTGVLAGVEIDFFHVVKKRLDTYVEAISRNPEAKTANDPAAAIGPQFATICGNGKDIYTRMTGASMFITNVNRVGQYLGGIGLKKA